MCHLDPKVLRRCPQSTVSAMQQLFTCKFLRAFPMKNTVGLVLEESKFSIPDNWLLFSIPKFFVLYVFFQLVQAAVRFFVPCQNSWRRSPCWCHRGRCCWTSSSRNEVNAKASKRFFLCVSEFRITSAFFPGDLWGTLPILLFWQNNKMIITGGPVVAALVCALFAVTGGGTCTGCRATCLRYYDGDRHGGGRW